LLFDESEMHTMSYGSPARHGHGDARLRITHQVCRGSLPVLLGSSMALSSPSQKGSWKPGRSQLDYLYQRVVNDLDELIEAICLKAA
jgi:hypothetical protein